MYLSEIGNWSDYLKTLLPYLDIPFEELVPENNQTMVLYETIKLLNEEIRMLNSKNT